MIELLGRVIRREIVNGNPVKLQRLDSLVVLSVLWDWLSDCGFLWDTGNLGSIFGKSVDIPIGKQLQFHYNSSLVRSCRDMLDVCFSRCRYSRCPTWKTKLSTSAHPFWNRWRVGMCWWCHVTWKVGIFRSKICLVEKKPHLVMGYLCSLPLCPSVHRFAFCMLIGGISNGQSSQPFLSSCLEIPNTHWF